MPRRNLHKSVKDVVEEVLTDDPTARIDNRRLVLEVWDRYGLHLSPKQWELLKRLPQPETIRRHRAKIQNEEGRLRP